MAPATISASSTSTSSGEMLSTPSSSDDFINNTTSTLQPSSSPEFPSVSSDDFLYDSGNSSTPPTYSSFNLNGTAGGVTNYSSISRESDDISIAVGGLDDIAMISSAEVMDGGANDFYRPHNLFLSPKQHVSTFPSNTTTTSGRDGASESANSNFMFLLEDLGGYFYDYNSTSNSESGNGGYYFSGITSTGFPNTTDYFQNCTNVTCIDSTAGLYIASFFLLLRGFPLRP